MQSCWIKFSPASSATASLTFNPERYSEITDRDGDTTDFWKLSMVIPVQTKRLYQEDGMGQASVNSTSVASCPIGHFVFDNET